MSSNKFIPVLLFLATFLILLFTSYPSIGWWDSGYYALCSNSLGIPEPGGSILYVLLGRLFIILFFFVQVIEAVTLVSIISTSLASVFFYYILLTMLNNFQIKIDKPVDISISFLTALSLPFLYSIWVESYVTRVYTLGLLLTGIILLCTVKIWFSENEDQKLRLFLLIVFLMGIDFSAHRLNSPIIPIIFILLIFPLRKYLLDIKFWILTIVVYTVSLSPHLYLLIRGQHHMPFDIGNTHTWGELMSWINIERIGSESNFSILFNRRAPLWDYQIKFMYLRYFGWNFFGKEGYFCIPYIPFIIGCIGFTFSLVKKFKLWILIFLTFIFFSIILIFYLNVVDGFHNIREIDRLFIPSFFIFLIWVGIGLYCLIIYILKLFSKNDKTNEIAFILLIVISFIIMPLNITVSNWYECNRNRYYFPEDFAYNILSSCEDNAVIFTNGDNDTFPLWYLQSVEGFRTDIIVANVNLLNTRFYIDQITKGENSFPVDSTITGSEHLAVSLMDAPIEIKIAPPKFPINNFSTSDTLKFSFTGHNFGDKNLLLVQDKVIISFLRENNWKRPVYFSTTVAPNNLLGLSDYLSNIGIVQKLLPVQNINILPEELEKNLFEVYKFRSLNDPNVRIEDFISSMYNNFRYAFYMLANHYLETGNKEKAIDIFNTMKEKLPDWRFSDAQSDFVKNFAQEIGYENIE